MSDGRPDWRKYLIHAVALLLLSIGATGCVGGVSLRGYQPGKNPEIDTYVREFGTRERAVKELQDALTTIGSFEGNGKYFYKTTKPLTGRVLRDAMVADNYYRLSATADIGGVTAVSQLVRCYPQKVLGGSILCLERPDPPQTTRFEYPRNCQVFYAPRSSSASWQKEIYFYVGYWVRKPEWMGNVFGPDGTRAYVTVAGEERRNRAAAALFILSSSQYDSKEQGNQAYPKGTDIGDVGSK